MITIYIDGACKPVNPGGYACWAYCAYDDNGKCIGQNYGCVGNGVGMTNNLAEHAACLEALKRAQSEGWTGCQIKSDSQLVVNQVNRNWTCNEERFIPILKQSILLLQSVPASIQWIPREENTRADHLSNVAYNSARVLA